MVGNLVEAYYYFHTDLIFLVHQAHIQGQELWQGSTGWGDGGNHAPQELVGVTTGRTKSWLVAAAGSQLLCNETRAGKATLIWVQMMRLAWYATLRDLWCHILGYACCAALLLDILAFHWTRYWNRPTVHRQRHHHWKMFHWLVSSRSRSVCVCARAHPPSRYCLCTPGHDCVHGVWFELGRRMLGCLGLLQEWRGSWTTTKTQGYLWEVPLAVLATMRSELLCWTCAWNYVCHSQGRCNNVGMNNLFYLRSLLPTCSQRLTVSNSRKVKLHTGTHPPRGSYLRCFQTHVSTFRWQDESFNIPQAPPTCPVISL